jgi:hypothetical protein
MKPPDPEDQLVLTEEKIGFEPDQLIQCSKCGRNNPPNRLECIYCATGLAVPEAVRATIRIDDKRLEVWENGFNIICVSATTGADLTKTAAAAGVGESFLRNILDNALPLPIRRMGSQAEADLVIERLMEGGIESRLIRDEELRSRRPSRLRAIEAAERGFMFILFNSDDVVHVSSDDIELIVFGRLLEIDIQSTELRKFRRAELDGNVTTKSKTSVIDIHTDEATFRILEHGFDFGCLASEKGYVASENMDKLAQLLRETATDAAYDANYELVRELLGEVWDLEETLDAGGVSRTGMGKLVVTRTSKQRNNDQFNKYSQMLRQLR